MLHGDHFKIADAFAETARAFRQLLRGETNDFSNCAETLDDWAARLVAAVLPDPLPQAEVRRELRRRGIAAFGMLAAA